MMFRLIKILLVITILISLVLFFTPLNLYLKHFEKDIRPLRLTNVQGSIIKGSSDLSYLGFNLGKVNWLNYPNQWNSIGFNLKLEDKDYDLRSEVSKKPGMIHAKNIIGTVDWSLIKNQLNLSRADIQGYFKLDLSEIIIKDKLPYSIKGRVSTKDFKINSPIKRDLGEVYIDFEPINTNVIVGTINSNSNVLNVSGALYIYKNHRWELKLNVIPLAGEFEIDYALRNFGDSRPGGGRTYNRAGFY